MYQEQQGSRSSDMKKWTIGAMVEAGPDGILTDDGDLDLEAGTVGYIVAVHDTAMGINGRFAKVVTVDFGRHGRMLLGSDELRIVPGPFLMPVPEGATLRARLRLARMVVDTLERSLRDIYEPFDYPEGIAPAR
jgi:hypothetical protein